jgi:large subunit ribosomal protein L18
MAKSANYRVPLRRRREGKTDYQARKAMVVSGRTRLVARPSIKNVNAQIIIAKPIGDQVLAAANSRELVKKYGWKAATGNLPAAYLTGLLCGLKAKAAGVDAAILDIGMVIPTKGSKVFAVLHGVIDAGVEVPHGEEKIVPGRSKGDHIATYAKELSGEDPELYAAKFSKYTAQGVAPEKVAEHFSKVRAAIVGSFKGAKVAPEPESEPEPKAKPKQAPKPEAKAAAPKAEVKAAPKPAEPKAAPVPKAEVKVESPKPEAVPKVEAKAPKAEAKPEVPAAKETKEAPKAKVVEAKAAPAKEAPVEKAEKAPKAEKAAAKEKAPKAEKAVKEKAPAAKEAKAKAASKEKAPAKKEAAPAKEKAPAKKATKKGEKKE